jgi:transcriptional regulator with XRE-family HTH domain
MEYPNLTVLTMDFGKRLATLRRERGLTQPALADAITISQLRRYEAGTSQPTLDVLRRLATHLAISADVLLFDPEERQPPAGLGPHLHALNQLPASEQATVRQLIEGALLRHQAHQITNAS